MPQTTSSRPPARLIQAPVVKLFLDQDKRGDGRDPEQVYDAGDEQRAIKAQQQPTQNAP